MMLNDVLGAGPARKKRKRVGRGIGSGWGKTAGRGTKGYHSRSGSGGKLGHEGGQMPLYRRLPRRGFTSLFGTVYTVVNVGKLEAAFEAGEEVSLDALKSRHLVRKNAKNLKVLGGGELTKALKVRAIVSKSARSKIEAASGSVIEADPAGAK